MCRAGHAQMHEGQLASQEVMHNVGNTLECHAIMNIWFCFESKNAHS